MPSPEASVLWWPCRAHVRGSVLIKNARLAVQGPAPLHGWRRQLPARRTQGRRSVCGRNELSILVPKTDHPRVRVGNPGPLDGEGRLAEGLSSGPCTNPSSEGSPAPRGGQQAGCGVAPGGRWALAGGAGSSSFPHSGRVRERPDRHAPETADGLVTWCPEGCPPCSPVLCGSWRGCRLGSVASDHRVGPQTAFLKGHGQSLSWLYAEEVSEAALDREKDSLGDPCTPRVSRRRVRFRICAAASDSTFSPQV